MQKSLPYVASATGNWLEEREGVDEGEEREGLDEGEETQQEEDRIFINRGKWPQSIYMTAHILGKYL